jgi:hypothetical protein
MRARSVAIGAVLAVLGLAAAVGIGLAANAISDDSVGLSAQPLSAGDSLAPPANDQKAKARRRERHRERGRQTDGKPSAGTATSPAAPQDDHGGGAEAGDDGGSGSASGSGSSGSGSSGSGSSGSGSSGSSGSGSSDSGGDDSGHGGDDD